MRTDLQEAPAVRPPETVPGTAGVPLRAARSGEAMMHPMNEPIAAG